MDRLPGRPLSRVHAAGSAPLRSAKSSRSAAATTIVFSSTATGRGIEAQSGGPAAAAQEEPSVIDVDVVAPRRELHRKQVFDGHRGHDDLRSFQQDRTSAGLTPTRTVEALIAMVILADDPTMTVKKALAMWLYPIAPKTDFIVGRRTSKRKGAAGFAEMVEQDASDDKWGLSKNFRNVSVGDEIVVYATKTSTSPPLIIGLGVVLKGPYTAKSRDTPLIKIKWNTTICERLGAEPIDATWLAKNLPVQKPAVTTIPERLWPKIRSLLFIDKQEAGVAKNMRVDVEQILSTSLPETEKDRLVAQRLGQGLFKINVGRVERGCRLTGVTDKAHLRASHIKPWNCSTNKERLDGNNGLLLAPHVDHLFDQGFIAFNARGRLLISPQLDVDVLKAWALPMKRSVGAFNRAQQRYLAYHRKEIFISR